MTDENRRAFPLIVTGATSLIGRFLLPRAAAEGRRVSAVTRGGGTGRGADWIAADLTAPDLARRLPEARDAVALSPIWLTPAAVPALAARGVTRLIAFSSTSRFTKAASPAADERAVAARLADGEAETIRLCEAHGVAWTILRPTMIYAEGLDRNVSRLASLIDRVGVLPLSGRGEGRRQPVHADDLAAAALTALDARVVHGRAYDLPGGETLTYREMTERLFQSLGRKPRILTVPPTLWRLGLLAASPLLPGATTAMGDRMAEDLVFDPSPARADLGWSPRPFRPMFLR
jgi:nucleoside-diphosphate-sugar epimerase